MLVTQQLLLLISCSPFLTVTFSWCFWACLACSSSFRSFYWRISLLRLLPFSWVSTHSAQFLDFLAALALKRSLSTSCLSSLIDWTSAYSHLRPRNWPCSNSRNSASVFSLACCQAFPLLLSCQMLISWISLGSWGRHRIFVRSHLSWRRTSLRILFVLLTLLTTFRLYWLACHLESKTALSCLVVVLLLELPTFSLCLFLVITRSEEICFELSDVLSYRWDLH